MCPSLATLGPIRAGAVDKNESTRVRHPRSPHERRPENPVMNRRDFFKIVTASSAAAATGGCQQASETILPLVVPNEQLVPGVASWFSTVCRECPAGCGVVARNRDGRVVKLEGNPDHPVNRGGLCIRGQAALQGLYHPDRVSGPQRRDGAIFASLGWDEALKAVGERLTAARGAGKGERRED